MNRDIPSLIEIKDLFGMEELKSFADKLVLTAKNAEQCSIQFPPLPNLILACGAGYGVTTHIKLLARLISETGLMRFVGEESYFEMSLSDMPRDFYLLLERINAAAGFYGEFRGIIGLDISALFKEKSRFDDFQDLLEYADLQKGRILFIFQVPLDSDTKRMTDFLHQFTSRTPVEVLRLPFPGTSDVLKFIQIHLEKQNMSLTEEAANALSEIVDELRKDQDFEGYQTLKNLIDELVWNKLSSASGNNGTINKSDLEFLSGSEQLLGVIRAQVRNREKKNHIGFC